MKYEPTNREKSKKAKKAGLHWCWKCDMALVGEHGKCPVCGKYHNRKKLKNF